MMRWWCIHRHTPATPCTQYVPIYLPVFIYTVCVQWSRCVCKQYYYPGSYSSVNSRRLSEDECWLLCAQRDDSSPRPRWFIYVGRHARNSRKTLRPPFKPTSIEENEVLNSTFFFFFYILRVFNLEPIYMIIIIFLITRVPTPPELFFQRMQWSKWCKRSRTHLSAIIDSRRVPRWLCRFLSARANSTYLCILWRPIPTTKTII